MSKKRKAKAILATIPNKFQLKHPYSKRAGTTTEMMKQFYRARISLRDMEKDYTVSTINQANKETPCLQTSSNIVAQTIEVSATNSISKLETKNINENIKNSSSNHPHDSKEIEHVKTIPGTSIRNRATKTKLDDIMLNQIEKGSRLSHEVVNLASSLLWNKRNIGGFEDTGLEWNQFSQTKGKDFGQILFIKEKEHWIFVYQKGGSNVNICDSLRNNGKQDYPENTVRAICRIACCMDSALKVNYLQVQQQSNSIDCGVFAITLLLMFILDCHQMKAFMMLLKGATTCQHVCNFRNYTFSEDFKEGSTL